MLDTVASGDESRLQVLTDFYLGGSGLVGKGSQASSPSSSTSAILMRENSSFPVGDSGIVLRVGRYGPYLDKDGQMANVPEDLAPDELTPEKAEELLAQPSERP